MTTAPEQPSNELSLTDATTYPRKVLFVAGAGRSGTSTMAGLMRIMGLHVPQPEVIADETNPKGFGEPRWVVDHHDRLLREALVQVSDARPEAWFETGRVATREQERIVTAEWLESHFQVSPELVVKDPRLGWFLGLWRVAAVRTGATPVFATMLRAPSEVVGSKQTYYANRLGSAHLAASWLNMMLHTERGTRESVADGGRVFVAVRRPPRRLGEVVDARRRDAPAPARAARRQRADPRGPPVRGPRAAPDEPDPRGPRPPEAAARAHRCHVGRAQQARRPGW